MKVVIGKADLDTCLTGLIFGVKRSDRLVVTRGTADKEDLCDPRVLCIEAGGSGETGLNNFDHHHPNHYFPPACRQVYARRQGRSTVMQRLVDYICCVDEAVPLKAPIAFPSLSNLFSGMKMVVHRPVEQFWEGVQILDCIIKREIDPFQTLPDNHRWASYVEAKKKMEAQLEADLEKAVFVYSRKGLKIGLGQSAAPGVPGRLYRCGCQVAVAFDPSRRKYTIASHAVTVSHLLSVFNAVENGWGGRARIIGSPVGSTLDPKEVLQLVLYRL